MICGPSHQFSLSLLIHVEDGGSTKRARLLPDQSDEYTDMSEDILASQKDDCCFEDLFEGAAHVKESPLNSRTESESWGLLNEHVLARIFHFLRADVKSLISSAATCSWWNTAAKYYRSVCRFIDLSSLGPQCTDNVFHDIMVCSLIFLTSRCFLCHLLTSGSKSCIFLSGWL